MPGKDGSTNVKASGRVRSEAEIKEGLEYKILPHVEQDATYGAVFQRLNEGGAIGIFPEGKLFSHLICEADSDSQAARMTEQTSFL